jgi:hypothetical protein
MAVDFDALDLVRTKNKAKMHEKKKAMSKKPEGWAVVVTWEREDKTWYTETITDLPETISIDIHDWLDKRAKEENAEIQS